MRSITLIIFGVALLLVGCSQANSSRQDIPSVSPQYTQTESLLQQVKDSDHGRVGVTCSVCHEMGGQAMFSLKRPGWEACASCHTAPTIVLGQKVENPQYDMIKGTGVGEIPDMPSLKYRLGDKFACYDCHLTDSTHHSFTVPGSVISGDAPTTIGANPQFDYTKFKQFLQTARCAICHIDPDATVAQSTQHRSDIEQKLNELQLIDYQWEQKVKELNPADPRVKALNEGRTYYTYVKADGSFGSHNYELTEALLNAALVKFSALK